MHNNQIAIEEDNHHSLSTSSENKALHRWIFRFKQNWYWFFLCALFAFGIAYFKVKYSVPSYYVRAKLLVSDDQKGGDLVSSSIVELTGSKSSVDNEVEVLKTADLMREMILAEDAYISYFHMGKIHTIPISSSPYRLKLLSSPDSIVSGVEYQIEESESNQFILRSEDEEFHVKAGEIFRQKGVGTLKIFKQNMPVNPSGHYKAIISPVRATVSNFMSMFSVNVTNKNVSTIELTLKSQIPKSGEQFLETLIDKYVERNLHDKNVVADSTLSFINTRLVKITEELAGVEDRISGYKKSTQLANISEQSKLLLESSADYTRSLGEVETQLSAIDEVLSYVSDARNPRVVPSSILSQDVNFSALSAKYNELILQKERLLLANTMDNPLVINVSSQIANIREDMISNLTSTRRQLDLAKENQLRMSNNLSSQILRVPTIERGFIDLSRLQQIKQAQYVFLQEKWEETAISRTSNVPNSKVIDSPKADQSPFEPRSSTIYGFFMIIGLSFPLLIIWLRDLTNIRVTDLEVLTSGRLPVLGSIAHSEEKEQVVVSKSSRSPIAEQFRAMRTNLEFALNGGKTLLFTSSMSGEGKSYVALNLAVALGLLDKKVLLMELDLRKPSITAKLDLPAGKGFSHYVVRPDMRLDEIIMPSRAHENVDLIQAGAIPPNPAELLVHGRTQQLMRELTERYDYILIDAPPVGMVTDAQLLSRYADCCLYLVRQGFTYKEQLRIPSDLVAQGKIKSIQIVINDVQKRGGYYSGYGYGYYYGDYGQEGKRKRWWTFWKR